MGRQQAVHPFKECLRRYGILEGQVLIQRVHIQFLFKPRELQNALDFTAIHKVVPHHGIMQRFNAKEVPRHKQTVIFSVVNGKTKHAAQPVEQFFLPLFKPMQQYFTVSLGCKHMTLFNQFLAQFLVVINFPVKREHQGLIFVINGLVAAFADINNAQPAEPHGNIVIRKDTAAVRPTMGNHIGHGFDHLIAVNHFAGKARNPTHNFLPSFFYPNNP